MKTYIWITLIFLIIFGKSNLLNARELSSVEVYFRCYAHFVKSRPLENDSRLLAVKAGTKSAVNACMELFDLARMPNGMLVQNQIPSSDDSNITLGSRIVKTFHNFHRTAMLQSDNLSEFASRATHTEWIVDSTNAAYFFTRALFEPGVEYKTVVTSNENIGAIRNSPNNGPFWNLRRDDSNTSGFIDPIDLTKFFVRYIISKVQTDILFSPEPLEFGSLIGFRTKNQQPLPPPPGGGATLSEDIHELLGGGAGAISTPAYFMLNSGQGFKETNGGAIVTRRWSKAVIHDLLCRELPVIRLSDSMAHSQPQSKISFRQNVSCMQCHHTMDNLAITTRNNVPAESGGFTDIPGNIHLQFVKKYQPDLGHYTSITDGYAQFHRTMPEGKFIFRSYDGNLIEEELLDISSVGNVLAQSKDLYACAAKRYFEFFTQIDASLEDLWDPDSTTTLNKRDYEYRKFVIQLGEELKSHQSLRELVKKIISSDYYKKSDYGVLE